jgi:hypothetical protein
MAEYTFGTHAKAIDQAESVKSKVWGPARNRSGLLACTFIVVGQQAYVDVQPQIRPSQQLGGAVVTPQMLGKYVSTVQADTTQIQPQIFKSVRGVAPSPAPIARIFASPQFADLTQQGQFSQPIVNTGWLVSYISAAPDPTEVASQIRYPWITASSATPPALPGNGPTVGASYTFGSHAAVLYNAEAAKTQVWRSVQASLTPPKPVAGYYFIAPQVIDLTLQPFYDAPTPSNQGRLGAQITAAPTDTSQLRPQVWASLVPPPIVPNPVSPYWKTYPQFEERPTVAIWPAQKAGSPPTFRPQGQSSPQQVDLSLQAFYDSPNPANQGVLGARHSVSQVDTTQIQPRVYLSARTTLIIANPVAPYYSLAPQLVDLTLQPVIRSPLLRTQGRVPPTIWAGQQINDLTPPSQQYPTPVAAIVHGPTLLRHYFVPEQANLQPNPSQVYVAAGSFTYTIDGSPTYSISSAHGSVIVYCDGNSNYYTLV